jgi:hypothetical protein
MAIVKLRPLVVAGILACPASPGFAWPAPNVGAAPSQIESLTVTQLTERMSSDLRSQSLTAKSDKDPDGARAEVISRYNAALKLFADKQYDAAYTEISETDAIADKNAYETGVVGSLKFILAVKLGKPDIAGSLFDSLPPDMPAEIKAAYLMEVVRLFQERHDGVHSVENARRYLAMGGIKRDKALGVIWRTSYNDKNYQDALKSSVEALDVVESGHGVPEEILLRVVQSSATKLQDDADAALATEKLAQYYPTPDHWNDLITDRLGRPGFPRLAMAIEVFRLMRATNALTTAAQVKSYAVLALDSGIPEEAQAAIELGRGKGLLSDQNQSADEAALRQRIAKQAEADRPTLDGSERDLAKAKDGEAAVRLGLCQAAVGDYAKAIALIEAGLAKGTKDNDLNRLRLGTVYVAAGDKDKAAETFSSIKSPAAAELAKLWLVRLRQT